MPNVLAWLVRIARNKAIDELRKHKPEILNDQDMDGPASGMNRPDLQLDNLQLWHEVNQLPGKQRQVVAYRYLGGMSYAQIAEILSGSEAAARRAGADGIKNLRVRLSGGRQPSGFIAAGKHRCRAGAGGIRIRGP